MLSHIRKVDIEIQSYCNRTCSWCPNSTFDRRYHDEMPDWMFSKILKELADGNFGKEKSFEGSKPIAGTTLADTFANNQPMISLLGYQEPFTNIPLLKRRVEEVWHKFPKVEILANTNGDFLTREALDGLLLTTLNIMDYDNKGVAYWEKRIEDIGGLIIDFDESNETIFAIHKNIGNIRCSCNWSKHIQLENRGGYFKQGDLPDCKWANDMEIRTAPCSDPSYFLWISYNGDVMPCCHIRFDNPLHSQYVLGNVKGNTLQEIHYSDNATQFKDVMSVENGDYPEPCKNCQKIRSGIYTGEPNGFDYYGYEYKYRKMVGE